MNKLFKKYMLGVKRSLASMAIARRIILPVLRVLNITIIWRHDITRRKMKIKLFSHKGYWYYGANREIDELNLFKRLVARGGCVLEVGGHIGYVTQIFEELVGQDGVVYVAEPTPQSRQLLKENVFPKTIVLPFAFSDKRGKVSFFTEGCGGFTNSMDYEFTKERWEYLKESQVNRKSELQSIIVDARTIDDICFEYNIKPTFIKVDVEGSELQVLKGAHDTLLSTNSLMVEISKNRDEIFDMLVGYGFSPYNSQGKNFGHGDVAGKNIFFTKEKLQ
jgi:FkbM family methyltransferase